MPKRQCQKGKKAWRGSIYLRLAAILLVDYVSFASQLRCRLKPADVGPCEYYQAAWTWNSARGECQPFNYGGCLGNANRFESRHDCERRCLAKIADPLRVPAQCLMDPEPGYCKWTMKNSRAIGVSPDSDASNASAAVRPPQWWYYFDSRTGLCTPFLHYGCGALASNANRFYNERECLVVCGLRNDDAQQRSYDSCWDAFDPTLRQQCQNGQWLQRYYFDASARRCRLFWWDGCRSESSRNFFTDLLNCQWLCEQDGAAESNGPEIGSVQHHAHRHHHLHRAQNTIPLLANACYDKFDDHNRDECDGGDWRTHYFFDKFTRKCVPFWYAGCESESGNNFADETTCIRACEQPALQLDHLQYGGLAKTTKGTTAATKTTTTAKITTTTTATIMWTKIRTTVMTATVPKKKDSQNWIEEKSELFTTALKAENVIAQQSQENGKKIGSENLAIGLGNRDVFEKKILPGNSRKKEEINGNDGEIEGAVSALPNGQIDNAKIGVNLSQNERLKSTRIPFFELRKIIGGKSAINNEADDTTNINGSRSSTLVRGACTPNSCKNGGNCVAAKKSAGKRQRIVDELWHECFCAKGFAGNECELKPCDEQPCRNNGTCRTTRGQPHYFFCECAQDWGGKTCIIPIPNDRSRKYGKNVQLLSSGRPEWIEQIKHINALKANQSISNNLAQSANKTTTEISALFGYIENLNQSATPASVLDGTFDEHFDMNVAAATNPSNITNISNIFSGAHSNNTGGFLPIRIDESPIRTLAGASSSHDASGGTVRRTNSIFSLTAIIVFMYNILFSNTIFQFH